MNTPTHAAHRCAARDPGRRSRQHADEPERRARPVLHAQPARADRQRRTHRRRRGARRRKIRQTLEDAAPLLVGQPIGNHLALLERVRTTFCRSRRRRPRAADLRPADDDPRRHRRRVGDARPARPAPRRPGRGAARRGHPARCGRDARLSVLRRRPHEDRPAGTSIRRAFRRTPMPGRAYATRRR